MLPDFVVLSLGGVTCVLEQVRVWSRCVAFPGSYWICQLHAGYFHGSQHEAGYLSGSSREQ